MSKSSLGPIANPPTEGGSHPAPASMQGQGGATAELEALRERVAKLEGEKSEPAPPRMVPLGAGFTDQYGRPVMVEARTENFGERLVRREFADIDRDEFLSDPTVQA